MGNVPYKAATLTFISSPSCSGNGSEKDERFSAASKLEARWIIYPRILLLLSKDNTGIEGSLDCSLDKHTWNTSGAHSDVKYPWADCSFAFPAALCTQKGIESERWLSKGGDQGAPCITKLQVE